MRGLVSAVLVIGIVLASTFLVLSQMNNLIGEYSSQQEFNEAKHIMNSLDSSIRQVNFESVTSSRKFNFDAKGRLQVIGALDEIIFYFGKAGFLDPSIRYTENNIVIEKGPFVSAYVTDIDKNGEDDLVLENERVLFSVKKLGDEENHTIVNTSNIITMIREKSKDTVFVPSTEIMINDAPIYGNGFTSLSKEGDYLLESSIIVYTDNNRVEFTLKSGWDFIEMVVY